MTQQHEVIDTAVGTPKPTDACAMCASYLADLRATQHKLDQAFATIDHQGTELATLRRVYGAVMASEEARALLTKHGALVVPLPPLTFAGRANVGRMLESVGHICPVEKERVYNRPGWLVICTDSHSELADFRAEVERQLPKDANGKCIVEVHAITAEDFEAHQKRNRLEVVNRIAPATESAS